VEELVLWLAPDSDCVATAFKVDGHDICVLLV
jgi:hypothetical protein